MSAKVFLDKLPEDWEAKFLEMYNTGTGDFEVMREFGIPLKNWKIMMNSLGESAFSEVVEFGHVLSQAWWEQQGRSNLKKRGFNTRLYEINMQNKFGWANKAEVNDPDSVGASDDKSLDRRIKELSKKVSGDVE